MGDAVSQTVARPPTTSSLQKSRTPTQEWWIANNGDVVPTTVLGQIAKAGGDVTSDASSIGDHGPGGFLLSDAAVDWIEETANHETDSDG